MEWLLDGNVLPSVLALLAALQFAAGTLLVKRGLQHMDSMTGAVVSIASSTTLYALAAPFAIRWEDWLSPAVLVFMAVGVLRPSVSTMLAYEGTRRVGPTIAATLESMSPLFAVAGGVVVLAERPTVPTLLGTLGVVGGVVVLAGKGRLPRSWPLLALGFPLGAALIRSGAHVALRWALLILPNVALAGLVAYGTSLVVGLGVRLTRPRTQGVVLTLAGVVWFALVGVTNAGAILAQNTALRIGEVVVVAPVTATYPVFTMLGSRLFYADEPLTRRTVAGVLLIVPSVILISLAR